MLLPVSLGGGAVDLVTFNHGKGLDGPGHARTFFVDFRLRNPHHH
jgi:hypothetical protein